MILGAHMSIAGGYYRSLDSGHENGCDCVQLFTKNNNQWRAKPITPEDVDRFQAAKEKYGYVHTLSHASYLINMGSPKDELREKSIDAMVEELKRAHLLGVPLVVVHPGSFTTSTEADGIKRIGESIDLVHDAAGDICSRLLLETTAGQGTNLGWRFEQLAAMLDACESSDRVGICCDTCHMFAAGYAMGTEAEWNDTWQQFDEILGLDKLLAFHLNDSKKEFGSRKDRHEHIGQGFMGIDPFRYLMNDNRFSHIPMYLETAKGDADGEYEGLTWDQVNLQVLRSL